VTRRIALTADGRESLVSLLADGLGAALGTPASRAQARQLVMAGAVRVNGRPARRPGWRPAAGARVEAEVDRARLRPVGPRGDRRASLGPERILYEDAALLAVDKPPGLPTHATADPARPHLVGLVSALLAERGGPAPVLAVHQRLDRDTSGVMLLVKDPAANAGIAAAFAAGRVAKTYLALTLRPRALPPVEWRSSGEVGPPGRKQAAATDFRVREVLPQALLVEASPRTGRRHQVRIHLADAGMPVLGDREHGGPAAAARAPRSMLHALRLALPHPLTARPLVIESPLPDDFNARLAALRAGARPRGRERRRSRGRPARP
jgi:23S rRNA-/tRNA-specific pseudouridylate synthase